MGRKIAVWTNKRNLIRKDVDMAKKRETLREKLNLFSEQHKTMSCEQTTLKQKT